MKRIFGRGFTLMELMVVVFIISVLAGVALPLVSKYLRKSKTAEAGLNLRKIYDGEVGYYIEERVTASGQVLPKEFLNAGPSPSTPKADKQTGNFEVTWPLLRFAPDGAVLFSYQALAGGQGTTASFTARAMGDIDGDGHTSIFERVGEVGTNTGEVIGGSALFTLDELE